MSSPLDSAPVIFRYTRRMALADGVLVDATQGEFAAVSREHFPEAIVTRARARRELWQTQSVTQKLTERQERRMEQ